MKVEGPGAARAWSGLRSAAVLGLGIATVASAVAAPPSAQAAPASAPAKRQTVPVDAAALRATTAALGDLGLALLRDAPGANAVVSPLAVATVLGLVHAGASGATEHEIEALFGGARTGAAAMRQALPALSAQLRDEGAAATPGPAARLAARAWVDRRVAADVPTSYKRRLALRHGADALTLSFADTEAARGQINRWTAEHTAGRVSELLPAGSLAKSTQITLTAAVHFRSAWDKPFDAGQTEARPFATSGGGQAAVPTLVDERPVAQAVVDGALLYALPFAGGYDLVVALPTGSASGEVEALLKGLSGASFARWHAALKAPPTARCAFALPKFSFAPKAGSIKAPLERLGVKRAFTDRAELRPMLGRSAAGAHVDDVHHAAGMAIDEAGGEAVAAAAATVKPKSLATPTPACAVDRAFAFVVMHRASGVPLFVGRVGDPARSE